MLDLLAFQKTFILAHLREGGVAADYTMGNGHDTLFLSETAGKNGKVFAFDIQPAAVESSRKLLTDSNAPENYTLICDSHHNADKYIDTKVNAGMFNLGWLPGGDKSVTTKRETTLPAIKGAIERMAPDGVLVVAVYPGHEEGTLEGIMIRDYLASLDRHKLMCAEFHMVNSPTSPFFFVIESK